MSVGTSLDMRMGSSFHERGSPIEMISEVQRIKRCPRSNAVKESLMEEKPIFNVSNSHQKGCQVIFPTVEEKWNPMNTMKRQCNIINLNWLTSSIEERHNQQEPSKYRRLWLNCFSDIYFSLNYIPSQPQHTHKEHSEILKRVVSNEVDVDVDVDMKRMKRARKILSSIASSMHLPMIRTLGWILSKLWRHLFSGIYVNLEAVQQLQKKLEETDANLILVPSHKSHLDYLMMSYICYAYGLPLPRIAAGNNLDLPIVGSILRASGSFFIRRSYKGDELYKNVLQSYLTSLLYSGCSIEFFIEGGRSRHGRICRPRLGLVSMIVNIYKERIVSQEKKKKDIYFLPISIDYDKVLELPGYCDQLIGKTKVQESLWQLLKSTFNLLFINCGKAYIRFGTPLSLKEHFEQNQSVHDLGNRIVQQIQKTATVTCTALTSSLLLAFGRYEDYEIIQLTNSLKWLVHMVNRKNSAELAHYSDIESMVSIAMDLLSTHLSRKKDKVRIANSLPLTLLQLSYYRNQLLHLFLPQATICLAVHSMLSSPILITKEMVLHKTDEIWQFLTHLCCHEKVDFHSIFQELLDDQVFSYDEIHANIIQHQQPYFQFYTSLVFPLIDGLWAILQVLQLNANESTIDMNGNEPVIDLNGNVNANEPTIHLNSNVNVNVNANKNAMELKELIRHVQRLIRNLCQDGKMLYPESICKESLHNCISFLEGHLQVVKQYTREKKACIEILVNPTVLQQFQCRVAVLRNVPALMSRRHPNPHDINRAYVVACSL